MKQHNVNTRRVKALQRLKDSKYFPKKDRTVEEWEARKQQEIQTLESRIRSS